MWRTLFIVLCAAVCTHAYINTLDLKDDSRKQIFIESFGFVKGGEMNMKVTKWEGAQDAQLGFVMFMTQTDTAEFGDDQVKTKWCDNPPKNWLTVSIPEATSDNGYKLAVTDEGWNEGSINSEGIYNLFFVKCDDKTKVSFKLELQQYNVKRGVKDFLPIGLSPLPSIYAVFAFAYFVMFFVWIFGYMRGQGNVRNKVHYLMALLVVFKCLSLFFYALEQQRVKTSGRPHGLEIAYYIFAVLRTASFFVIVTLIGTGWSFFKPFLSDKDKKIIMVVIPLQILDNVAMVIVGVHDPGYFGLLAWKDIFRLVDIVCCGAILIPIIWSIKHLREASQSDGKAARNLQKLKLFRQFYLIVVSYIYFTRIIIYLLDATLPFRLIFLGDIFTELATLSFFLVVGYKFRPVPANPYFNMEEEDAVRMEEMRTQLEED